MREDVKRFLKRRVLPFFLVFLTAFAFFVAVFVWKCAFVKAAAGAFHRSRRQAGASGPDIGEKNRRPVEDAYYSYPEWYIVWSYEARAQYLPKNLPSGFPYFASIGQYWRSYCFICGLTRSRHQFNFGDHLSSFWAEASLSNIPFAEAMNRRLGASASGQVRTNSWKKTRTPRVWRSNTPTSFTSVRFRNFIFHAH